jgi:DNA-binding SARP family transcriptional activator
MQVRLFGWFEAEIDGRPIPWIRRRDREIFQYVALKSGGIASRGELGEAFWPGVEKHLVAQSLRTACSNMRKAIAHLVGFDQVETYFRTGHSDVSIDPDNVVVDVKSFIAHANDGDEQYGRGELEAALVHYHLAEGLHSGSLLIGHGSGSWVALQAANLERRHLTILERLSEISADPQRVLWSDGRFAAGT